MLRKGTFLLIALLSFGLHRANADIIYSGTGATISRSDNSGGDNKTFITGLSTGDNKGVFYDLTSKTVYFTDGVFIKSSDRSGGNITTIVTGANTLYDVVVDQVNNRVIWTDLEAGLVRSVRFDGSNPQTLATGSGTASLAIDAVKGKIYWTELVSGSVRRANLDGTNTETIAINQGNPSGIVVDVVNERVYWTSQSQNLIKRANLNGTSQTNVVAGLNSPPLGLTLGQGQLYWTSVSGAIFRANIDGSGLTQLGTVSNSTDVEFTADVIAPTPTPTATPTSTATGSPTVTPTGSVTVVPTVTGSPTVGGPTATPIPGTTPTVAGTPGTPGPTPTPTPLPDSLAKATRLFGYVLNGTTPVQNVIVNGGDLGLAATDDIGQFEFLRATAGTTYTFVPERTGLAFDPTSATLTAQIGASVPFFSIAAIATLPPGCSTDDVTGQEITINASAREVRNLIVSELARLNRLERRSKKLQRSRTQRDQITADAKATFLALTANSVNLPEIIFTCADAVACPAVSLEAVIAADVSNVSTLRRLGKQTAKLVTQAGDKARGTRVNSTVSRKTRTATVLLRELPGDTDICS